MRKLARRADLSVPTLYNLFGGREEILKALVVEAIDRMDAILEHEAKRADLTGKLAALAQRLFDQGRPGAPALGLECLEAMPQIHER